MALTAWSTFAAANPKKVKEMQQTAIIVKGVGVNEFYIAEADAATGGLVVAGTFSPSFTTATHHAEGKVAFGGIGAGYAALLTTSADARIIMLRNSCDVPVVISMDAGATDHFTLASNEDITIDYGASARKLDSGTQIQVKQEAAGPTSGSVKANIIE